LYKPISLQCSDRERRVWCYETVKAMTSDTVKASLVRRWWSVTRRHGGVLKFQHSKKLPYDGATVLSNACIARVNTIILCH